MVVCVADVEPPPFIACEHHAPWCLAYDHLQDWQQGCSHGRPAAVVSPWNPCAAEGQMIDQLKSKSTVAAAQEPIIKLNNEKDMFVVS